jgi:hypothetical protein
MKGWITIVLLALLGTARAQKAQFEDLRADAHKVTDLAELVRPFVETCADNDDQARRECEGARRFLQDHTRGLRLTMTVEHALELAPYQGKSKSVPVTVRGCVTCGAQGIEVDGHKVWLGVAPKAELAKRMIPVPVEQIKQWQRDVAPQLRTEMIFGLANRPVPGAPEKALAVEIIGWRVLNRCTGEVLFSEPPSKGRAEISPHARAECPKAEEAAKVTENAAPDARPEKLGRYEIEQVLAGAKPKVKACYEQYEIAGRADVVLDIQSDGLLQSAHVKGTFEGTPTARCILQALEGLRFPAFKNPKQTIDYPFYLR